MKIVKNPTEIVGFKSAMLKDGIALVKFLKWLDERYADGASLTRESERSVDGVLTDFRAEQPHYKGLSFDTIAAYGAHGAIVHYEASQETDKTLEPRGFLLLDSGAHYLDGTTDVTRTIALGPLTEEEKKIYTLVLKGHIRIELCKFPSGISGTQIDVLAREAMWREGFNYLHGTGHGVGSYLCVHEGSHQIRMEWRPTPLVEGMTVTDEPGIYLAERFGVRIENTLLIVPYKETEFGRFLQFEPLTLCPIDKRPILVEMLSDEELDWLNTYHSMVYDHLSLSLDEPHRKWLLQATSPLTR
jgi:Xaa-Pro aminopeptidase